MNEEARAKEILATFCKSHESFGHCEYQVGVLQKEIMQRGITLPVGEVVLCIRDEIDGDLCILSDKLLRCRTYMNPANEKKIVIQDFTVGQKKS